LHHRVGALRQGNYRMRSVQSKGYSEKAEVENIFLEAVEEVKKDL